MGGVPRRTSGTRGFRHCHAELAIAGVPTAAAYLVSSIEEIVARLMGLHRRLTTVILANLVLGENVVPEFLQRDCTAQKLADALTPLLRLDRPERTRQSRPSAG